MWGKERDTGRERVKEQEQSHAKAESILTALAGRKTDGRRNSLARTPGRISHACRDVRREGN